MLQYLDSLGSSAAANGDEHLNERKRKVKAASIMNLLADDLIEQLSDSNINSNLNSNLNAQPTSDTESNSNGDIETRQKDELWSDFFEDEQHFVQTRASKDWRTQKT